MCVFTQNIRNFTTKLEEESEKLTTFKKNYSNSFKITYKYTHTPCGVCFGRNGTDKMCSLQL